MTTFSESKIIAAGQRYLRDNQPPFEVAAGLVAYHLLCASEYQSITSENYYLLVKIIKRKLAGNDVVLKAALAFAASLNQSKAEEDDDLIG